MKRAVLFTFAIFLLIALPFAAAQESADDDAAQTPDAIIETEAQDSEDAVTEDAPVIPTHTLRSGEDAEEAALEETAATETHSLNFSTRLGIALGIVAVLALLIWLIWQFFKRLSQKVSLSAGDKIKPLVIKKLKLLTAQQIIDTIIFFFFLLKYLVTALLLFITLPLVFSLFPVTRNLATTLFGYILHPLRDIAVGIINYIPKLIIIIIIVTITRYLTKALKFFSIHIDKGKLVIPGFYAEWAEPTYRILQVLLWAFTVALAYPYLPGSDSKVFQGISVFLGIIFSLGSTSAIGNLVAGLVITYMRPFKIGDRVQIKDSTGFVVEKNLMVVRLKTHKNEYVTFPNTLILSSGIINYNTSSDEDEEGLILNAEVTFGYETPWQTVHEILINAALETDQVLKKPKPFVLQTGLDDFYARYQINCYTKAVDRVPKIYAALYENIQNGFRKAGLDMTSPHYEVAVMKKG
jgi:small-conductance mechanosensitive channel